MKQRIIMVTTVALILTSQLVTAGSITDSYTTGDTLTAATIDNIKTEVNDNDTRIVTNALTTTANEVGIARQLAGAPGLGASRNITLSSITNDGWAECYSETYGSNTSLIADILIACDGANLMLACRLVADPTNVILAANAPRADVIFDTGNNTDVTHYKNGVEWYFNSSRSWGFALAGDGVTKGSCDTASANPDYRMCFHTSGGVVTGGYRCGSNSSLNSSTTYERIWFQKN